MLRIFAFTGHQLAKCSGMWSKLTSNPFLKFMGWIDQRHSDFGKSRSLSIRATKNALENQGFTLPEPIYRLRFDNAAGVTPESIQAIQSASEGDGKSDAQIREKAESRIQRANARAVQTELMNVEPETHVSEQVCQERSASDEEDLLDASRPIE